MQGRDEDKLRNWVWRELLPPVVRWLEAERLPLSARAIQARACRALEMEEIDEHVCHAIVMRTDPILRWCAAEVVGQISAWIEPSGKTYRLSYGGHWDWIKANLQYLQAQGIVSASDQGKVGAIVVEMMTNGWIRYSAGDVVTGPMPNSTQLQQVQQLVAEVPTVPGGAIRLQFLMAGVHAEVPVDQVLSQGIEAVVSGQGDRSERTADFGGGTDGPWQEGDGQDQPNTFVEQLEEGSKGPIDRAYNYMKQDWTPDVWWAQNLTQYLRKNYPGNPGVGGAQSDAGSIPSATGPGQQFARTVGNIVRVAERSARRVAAMLRCADMTDPSDTDGQHDQVNEDSMETHTIDPQNQFNRKQKGLGAPTQEPKTRLGERWRQRRSDKAVEKQIIQMEKDHLEPGEIKQELRQDGVPAKVIDETYENRDKNLIKEISL